MNINVNGFTIFLKFQRQKQNSALAHCLLFRVRRENEMIAY